jgi:hypothetical protein
MPLRGKGGNIKRSVFRKTITERRLLYKPQECLSERRNSLDIVGKRKEKFYGFEVMWFYRQNKNKWKFDFSQF